MARLAVGCAQYLYHIYHKNPRVIEQDQSKVILENVYVGPSYTNDEIKSFLDSKGISYEKLEREELLVKTAQLIADGNIVGWYYEIMFNL